ncbi:MAG: ribonuclease III [Chloroflexia bacterium]|nr:ribonuclease III [Chloroflexia bacterium]
MAERTERDQELRVKRSRRARAKRAEAAQDAELPEGQLAAAAPDPVEDSPARLAAKLRLRFKDPELLRLALTHRSLVHDLLALGGDPVLAAAQTNERLEFLGDAVLGAIVAEYLYALDPLADEGTLTKRRVALIRAETLVRWAREIDLGSYLYLGPNEQPGDSSRDRMLAGAFEALLGAIALDRGPRAARRFLGRFLARDGLEIIAAADGIENPKGRLQEIMHDRFKTAPSYRVVASAGPEHAREFTVEVTMEGRMLGLGTGASKREAEQVAAAAALTVLATEEPPLAPA